MTSDAAAPANVSAPASRPVLSPKQRRNKPASSSPELAALQDIAAKLDRVIAVLAAQGKEKDKQVEILSAAGCDSKFIGKVVGMTGASVRKFQSRQRGKSNDSVADVVDTP